MVMVKKFSLLLLIITLIGCTSTHHQASKQVTKDGPPSFEIDVSRIPNATPKLEPLSAYGNPATYTVWGKKYRVMQNAKGYKAKGFASWYGNKFHRKRTSSGEPYSMFLMTAAHRTLPIPTYAQVTNLKTGQKIVVKINDRGPFHDDRLIDLSYVAAKKIGIVGKGTGLVQVEAIDLHGKKLPSPEIPNQIANAKPEKKIVEKTAENTNLKPPSLPELKNNKQPLYLQVGAFGKRSNALQFVTKVKRIISYPVKIIVHNNSKDKYKVQIGPLKNLALSKSVSKKLQLAGLGNKITSVS